MSIATHNYSLSINNLSCFKGRSVLFDSLSFDVGSGNGVHIIGRNGTGKTTLLRCLAGLNKSYTGHFDLIDLNLNLKIPSMYEILYIGHLNALNDKLTPLENLSWWCSLHNKSYNKITKIDLIEILYKLGLKKELNIPCYQLSAGQKRRISLSKLYLSDHKIWILDEPFTSLDNESSKIFEEKIIEHIKKGNLSLITSHQVTSLINFKVLNLDHYQNENF